MPLIETLGDGKVRILEEGWDFIMDTRLMTDRPIAEIAAETGMAEDDLTVLRAIAAISWKQSEA